MNIMQRSKRAGLIGTVCAVLAGLGLSGIIGASVPAAQAEETGSITVNFVVDKTDNKGNVVKDEAGENVKTAVAGATFKLYQIGEWNGAEGRYDPIGAFKDGVFNQIGIAGNDGGTITITQIMGATSSQLRGLAKTLHNYIQQTNGTGGNIEELKSGVTDANGTLKFDGLGRGLYLVDSPIHKVETTTAQGKKVTTSYEASYSLVALPDVNGDDSMNVTIHPKKNPVTGLDPIHVKKVWKNDDPNTRPKSVKVSLWMEGHDTPLNSVELSAENNWTYVFDNLPVGDRYFVVEDNVPDGYHVFIDEDIINPETADFTITNSKPEKPTKPEQPTTPTTPTTPTSQVTPGKPARTGVDIAVVAIMAAAAVGIAVVLILEVRKARARENK